MDIFGGYVLWKGGKGRLSNRHFDEAFNLHMVELYECTISVERILNQRVSMYGWIWFRVLHGLLKLALMVDHWSRSNTVLNLWVDWAN
jgi:hypothetical protein